MKKLLFVAIALMAAMTMVGLTIAFTRQDKAETDAVEDAAIA